MNKLDVWFPHLANNVVHNQLGGKADIFVYHQIENKRNSQTHVNYCEKQTFTALSKYMWQNKKKRAIGEDMITSVGHPHKEKLHMTIIMWNTGHIRSCKYTDLCNFNLLQTESEGQTKDRWPKVMAVWTKHSEVCTKMNKGGKLLKKPWSCVSEEYYNRARNNFRRGSGHDDQPNSF